MILRDIISIGILSLIPSALFAQRPAISLWNQSLIDKCMDGVNLSAAGATDPNRATGSVYFKTVTPDGADVFQVIPLGLPLTEGVAATPDKATCDLEFRVSAGAGVDVLGIAKLGGATEKIYHMAVRQIGQRKVDYIVEDGVPRTPWNSKRYLSLLQSTLFTKPTTAWGIDVVNTYLVTLEQFDKINGNINAGWDIVTANGNFQRSSGFSVAKVVLTGTPVLLNATKILAADETVFTKPLTAQGTEAVAAIAAPPPGTPADASSVKAATDSLEALIPRSGPNR